MIVGARVKEKRLEKGLTQKQLGTLIGVRKPSISGYETGNRTPSLEKFIDLLNVLDVSPSCLLGREVKVIADKDIEYKAIISKDDIDIIKYLKLKPYNIKN